jgi:hypothetical protein
MKTHARVLGALIGSIALFSYANPAFASEDGAPSHQAAKKPDSQADIYDPLGLVSPKAKLETLAEGFSFAEGPAADRRGNVFFTDQPNDKIFRWDARSGKVALFLEGTGRSNGMAFDREGNLIACADMYGELWKIYPDGRHEVIVDNYQGKRLNGPNDVWVNPVNGGILQIRSFRETTGTKTIRAGKGGSRSDRSRRRAAKAAMSTTFRPEARH